MGHPADKQATYEDLVAVPAPLVAEIVNGQLHTHPRPAFPHAVAASELGSELIPPFRRGRGGPGGWVILDEPELHLGSDVLVPDLAGWRRERMPTIPETAATNIAPNWVCEVLSPSTAGVDRIEKLPIYLREGVEHVWFIDPTVRSLEIFAQREGCCALIGAWSGNVVVRAIPFDAIELDLAVLWQR